jgi:hypothetical protein
LEKELGEEMRKRKKVQHFFLYPSLIFAILNFLLFFPYNVQSDRPQMTIWRMRFACNITRATNTHLKYVILSAFVLQQWLRERTSALRYAYFDCLLSTLSLEMSG